MRKDSMKPRGTMALNVEGFPSLWALYLDSSPCK